MAIDYLSTPARPQCAEMLATSTDVAHLRSFVTADTSVSAASAAAAVVRVVQDASSASGADADAVAAAQTALHHLCRAPNAHAIPGLLVVCEYQVSFDIVDVFKLYSAAWKVVTATCLKGADATQIPVPVRLRVLASALVGVRNMLHEMAWRSSERWNLQLGGNPATTLTRYLKIARFHAINAARCCKAFLNFHNGHATDQEKWVGVTGQVMRLLACVTHAAFYNDQIPEAVRKDLIQNVCPALGGIMRSFLSMVYSQGAATCPETLLLKALNATPTEQESSFLRAFGVQTEHARILAILLLLRLSASQTSHTPNEEGSQCQHQACDNCILLCQKALQSALLPVLFASLDSVQVKLFTLRELQSGLTLFECVSSIAVQCTRLYNTTCTSRDDWDTLEDFLLAEINSRSALRALLSHRLILGLMDAQKNNEQGRHRLLFVVLRATRFSFSLGTGYAERRWIPLAGALGFMLLQTDENFDEVVQMYQKARGIISGPDVEPTSSAVLDATILRFLSCLCGLVLSHGGEKVNQSRGLSPQFPGHDLDALSRVFEAVGLNRARLCEVVKGIVHTESHGGNLSDAALHLLPFLVDGKSATEAALSCLRRDRAPVQTLQRALNILNPALMSVPAIQSACTHAEALIKSKGTAICAPASAFVARASMSLHRSVSISNWHQLASLLELAVLTSGRQTLRESCIKRLREAAVFHHATQVLRATSALSRNLPGRHTQVVLPRSILGPIEESQARLQQLQCSANMPQPVQWNEFQLRCVLMEQSECAQLYSGEESSQTRTSSFSDIEALHSKILLRARRVGDQDSDSTMNRSYCRGVADELKDLLFILENASTRKLQSKRKGPS